MTHDNYNAAIIYKYNHCPKFQSVFLIKVKLIANS